MLTSHGVEHTATLMSDGRVLVVGGAVGAGLQSDRVEIFDPQTDTWYGAMPLEFDRASHTAQLLEDGRVLVAGGGSALGFPAGGDALVYDPQMNTWSATGPMVNMRINGKSLRLSDGRVLVVGGINWSIRLTRCERRSRAQKFMIPLRILGLPQEAYYRHATGTC